MIKNMIVKKPGRSLVNGLTTADLGSPVYERALAQHAGYIKVMESCGVKVKVLEAEEAYPDGCFVEDPAVVTGKMAVITNPGAPSRKGERAAVKEALEEFYTNFEFIRDPGTLDGGDVMRVEGHFYVGLSTRTNEEGAKQFIGIMERHGYSGSVIQLAEMFHLKTGVNYLGDNTLLMAGEFIQHREFSGFNKIVVDDDEMYAANCLQVNGTLVAPAGFPKTRAKLLAAGYTLKEVNMTEFQKLDGGLSCLSLRF